MYVYTYINVCKPHYVTEYLYSGYRLHHKSVVFTTKLWIHGIMATR